MDNWQWRLRRIKRQITDFFSTVNQKSEDEKGRPPIKMCPECGNFVDKKAARCEYCSHDFNIKPAASELKDDATPTTNLMDNPGIILFGICILVYMLSLYFSSLAEDYNIFADFWSPSGKALHVLGANTADYYLIPWRWITYNFLHGGFIHLAFNLTALSHLTSASMNFVGNRRYWLAILFTGTMGGMVSNLGTQLMGGMPFSVGLSGALFGLLGMNWAFFKKQGIRAAEEQYRYMMIWFNVLFILLSSFGIFRVDNLAHLGGMFAGMGLGYLYQHPWFRRNGEVIEKIVLGLLLALLTYGVYIVALLVNQFYF